MKSQIILSWVQKWVLPQPVMVWFSSLQGAIDEHKVSPTFVCHSSETIKQIELIGVLWSEYLIY